MTDVSIIPRGRLGLLMGTKLLLDPRVHVVPKFYIINRGRTRKRRRDRFCGNKAPPMKRCQFRQGNPVSRNDQGFSALKRPHDFPTMIPKLSLRDLSHYDEIVAHVRRPRNTHRINAERRRQWEVLRTVERRQPHRNHLPGQ